MRPVEAVCSSLTEGNWKPWELVMGPCASCILGIGFLINRYFRDL